MADPTAEICPDFGAEFYENIRADIHAATAQTDAQIIDRLIQSWTEGHNHRVEVWNQQREEEEQATAEAARAHAAQEEEARRQQEIEAAKEQLEAEKKKPKMNGFSDKLSVGDFISLRPAQYALQKINNFELVELWYFSQDGCKDALSTSRTIAEDAFGFTKIDDSLAIRPLSAFKASRAVLADHELSFSTFLRAKNSFLSHISKAKWPQEHVDSLSLFFWHLENHPIRNHSDIGDSVILTYASRVRQDWHDRLKRDEGFNIGIINETLLRAISEELWDKIRSRTLNRQ